MRRPVDSPYTITTEFGVPDSNALFGRHSGVDYGVGTGTPIYAPAAGTVTFAQMHPIRGNMVCIFDGTYTHRLMHNSVFRVSAGDRVTESQLVALSGATGLATGPHCHWDIIRGNKTDAASFAEFVDPAALLFATPTPPPAPIQDVLQAYQRRVKSDDSVNYRDAPNRGGKVLQTWPPNDVADFKGFVTGEAVEGNNVWFVGRYSGGYSWSGGFTDSSTNGLADLNAPAPAPTPTPTQPVYTSRPTIGGVWGVDVSAFQKTLDFNALRDQGIGLAILRAGHVGASYGGNATKTDPTLVTFQRDARSAGLAVGYYWYCYFDEDAQTEAGRFVQSVGPFNSGEPLFADVEEVDGANKQWLQTFVETVEQLSGRRCHIYTYANYLQNHAWILELLGDRKLWLAHYDIEPGAITTHGMASPVMHQYTSKGVLKGVGSQYIDLNIYFGTVDNFKSLGDAMPVLTPTVPDEPETPLPTNDPPAPLPTPDNNPVRPKVQAAGIAGLVLTVLLALLNALFPGSTPTELDVAPLVSAVTTAVTFGAAYWKRDGLSPK